MESAILLRRLYLLAIRKYYKKILITPWIRGVGMYRFNIYSWILFLIYLTVVTIMEYFSHTFSLENIYISIPLIAMFIFWSEKTTLVIQKRDISITNKEVFNRDLFFVSYSFISGNLISLLFQYNNSDTLGWWPLAIYIVSTFGVIYAFLFSLIAMTLKNHKKYTLIFSIVLISILIFISLMMHLNPLSIYAKYETFYIIFFILITLHLAICLGYKYICSRLIK